MKTTYEYALVVLGGMFFSAALLNFIWLWSESYPRNVPTGMAVPGCFIACLWCLKKAANISVSRYLTPPPV